MAFLDLTTLKGYLGIPASDTTRDTLLTALVDMSNAEMAAFFGLTTDAVTAYTDTIDVLDVDDGIWQVWTRRYPVVAISSVTEAGSVVASTGYALALDFGLVKRLGDLTSWAIGRSGVVIAYTAGFSAVPGDLKHAAALIAVHAFNTAPRSGLKSEKIGQYSYELGGASVAGGESGGGGFGIPPEAERILAKWRRPFAATPN